MQTVGGGGSEMERIRIWKYIQKPKACNENKREFI